MRSFSAMSRTWLLTVFTSAFICLATSDLRPCFRRRVRTRHSRSVKVIDPSGFAHSVGMSESCRQYDGVPLGIGTDASRSALHDEKHSEHDHHETQECGLIRSPGSSTANSPYATPVAEMSHDGK